MATRALDPPLDEIQWRSPAWAQQMMGIHSNSVLPYFAKSPFFDPTSNNAVLENQAMYNQNMVNIVATREAFEGRLKTMSGLEYVVAQEPAETAPGTGTGVWVIRKQTRRKRQGQEDDITIHSTYFVMGENIYMAPAFLDVVGSRMLSIFTSLDKFVSAANALPNFTPLSGHTYLPPVAPRPKATDSQLATQTSRQGSPLSDSAGGSRKQVAGTTSTYMDARLLDESFQLSMRYGDEYMDENPITGHPGAFNLTSTGRKAKDTLGAPAQKAGLQDSTKIGASPVDEKASDIPPTRKGSKAAEKAPRTPGIPKPKRKKSKVLSAGGVTPV
ncbi:hypothetical protein VE00_01114 [Pseudogymnoascus sp. WSF 3629]|nr:hypothetical protein VE00_01114 [Pseudogymnoascus sp. WSF 3629]